MRTAADIRRMNSFEVIRLLHSAGSASRRELAESTGLSFATVAAICTQLLERGILVEISRERATAGRPTGRLSLNAAHGILLGVDLAETYVHVETLNAALEPLSSTELQIDVHSRRPRQVVARVVEAITTELGRSPGATVLGVGVSAPGQVDPVGGTSIFAPNWDWHNVPLLEMLAPAVDAPLFLDNPLKAQVIAELWTHPERVRQDFAVVNLGTGVGLGAALDGRVVRGRTNSAGEWGHTVIVAGGRQCRCGSRGCVETYVGAPGVLQTLRELAPESALLHGDDQTATIAALAAGLAEGDPDAASVLERTAHFLGIGLATIVNLLNPEVIVIGGWVTRVLGDDLLEAARPHIAAHALAVPMMASVFELQGPRENAVSLGAAAFALEGYLDSIPDSRSESTPAVSGTTTRARG